MYTVALWPQNEQSLAAMLDYGVTSIQEIRKSKGRDRMRARRNGRTGWLEACQGMGIYEHEGALWLKTTE